MRFEIKHGASIETLTPAEAQKLLDAVRDRDRTQRVRAPAIVLLDANGSGQDEVYTVPPGFEFEARRVTLDIDTASDPINGGVFLAQQGHVADWELNSAPGNNAQATATRAGVPNVSHVLTNLLATVFQPAAPGAATEAIVVVRDGATGVGAILYEGAMKVTTAANDVNSLYLPGLNIVGTPGNAMTVEFQAASGANTQEVISAVGYDQYAPGVGPVRAVEFLRSGNRMEYAVPTGPAGTPQIPGVQTWGAEQGPYLRNGEVFEVKARGLTPNSRLTAIVEGILRRPYAPQQDKPQ